jgi:hypothetical protein
LKKVGFRGTMPIEPCQYKRVWNRDFAINQHIRRYFYIRHLLYDSDGSQSAIACDYITPLVSNLREFELGPDAIRIYSEPNAGGRSINSEALSMEYLNRTMGGNFVRTEMEIEYWNASWKKCDYICKIRSENVGVSVTRAMGYPSAGYFKPSDATRLLEKKLYGLVVARSGVWDNETFYKSILHIWCQSERIARLMIRSYTHEISDDLKDNIVVLLTVTSQDTPWIYRDSTDDSQIRRYREE